MRKPRHVSPDERALWDTVARSATPISEAPFASLKGDQPKERPAIAPKSQKFRLGARATSVKSHNLAPSIADQLRSAPLNMDARAFGNMKRGKLKPEGRIDLHGMTLSEAHPELIDFIMNSVAKGKRLVLVITGKGKAKDAGSPIPVRHGVLRHQVPQWLSLPPVNSVVLQVTPAHIRHGGEGAYYVYLRRGR